MRQFHTQKTEPEIPKPGALKGWSIPEAQWLRAMELLADSPMKGLEVLRRLEVNYPPDVDVYYNAGVALLHLGRYDEAERYFEKAFQIEPDNEYVRENLYSLLSLKKILSKRCSQDDLEEMGTVANTARDAGMLELAERIGNLMVDIDRGPGAFNDLGLTFQYQQEFEKAIQCYDKALGIDPDMREALSNKAFCLMMTEKLDEAYTLYKRILEMTPDFLQGWYHMGVINVWKEKYEEALPHLDKAIELNDEYYLAWFAKFEALKKLKRTDQANQCLEKAMSLNPEHCMELALGVADFVQTTHMHTKNPRS